MDLLNLLHFEQFQQHPWAKQGSKDDPIKVLENSTKLIILSLDSELHCGIHVTFLELSQLSGRLQNLPRDLQYFQHWKYQRSLERKLEVPGEDNLSHPSIHNFSFKCCDSLGLENVSLASEHLQVIFKKLTLYYI